jgi:hypothetical protein
MLRFLTAALALSVPAAVLTAPALAQTQKYDSWVYESMVPAGPELQNLEQAQPLPEQRPSHWGGVDRQYQGAYSQKHRLNLGNANNRTPAGNPTGRNNTPAGNPYGTAAR